MVCRKKTKQRIALGCGYEHKSKETPDLGKCASIDCEVQVELWHNCNYFIELN